MKKLLVILLAIITALLITWVVRELVLEKDVIYKDGKYRVTMWVADSKEGEENLYTRVEHDNKFIERKAEPLKHREYVEIRDTTWIDTAYFEEQMRLEQLDDGDCIYFRPALAPIATYHWRTADGKSFVHTAHVHYMYYDSCVSINYIDSTDICNERAWALDVIRNHRTREAIRIAKEKERQGKIDRVNSLIRNIDKICREL
jgi:hypothetical protein